MYFGTRFIPLSRLNAAIEWGAKVAAYSRGSRLVFIDRHERIVAVYYDEANLIRLLSDHIEQTTSWEFQAYIPVDPQAARERQAKYVICG